MEEKKFHVISLSAHGLVHAVKKGELIPFQPFVNGYVVEIYIGKHALNSAFIGKPVIFFMEDVMTVANGLTPVEAGHVAAWYDQDYDRIYVTNQLIAEKLIVEFSKILLKKQGNKLPVLHV